MECLRGGACCRIDQVIALNKNRFTRSADLIRCCIEKAEFSTYQM